MNEAIQSVKMACLTDQGPFSEVKVKAVDDTRGELGRSAARNTAIKASRADWLFFLDADDLMHPDALSSVEDLRFESCPDAVWGQITELRDGCISSRFQMPFIKGFKELITIDPYYTLQMGFFVKREVMPLFDEGMNTGEDWKVYIHLWKHHECVKIDKPLMVNRRGQHSTGPKSATGRDWMNVVHGMIETERLALG